MAVAILIHLLSVNFWIIQILLSYFQNSQVRNYTFFLFYWGIARSPKET